MVKYIANEHKKVKFSNDNLKLKQIQIKMHQNKTKQNKKNKVLC